MKCFRQPDNSKAGAKLCARPSVNTRAPPAASYPVQQGDSREEVPRNPHLAQRLSSVFIFPQLDLSETSESSTLFQDRPVLCCSKNSMNQAVPRLTVHALPGLTVYAPHSCYLCPQLSAAMFPLILNKCLWLNPSIQTHSCFMTLVCPFRT